MNDPTLVHTRARNLSHAIRASDLVSCVAPPFHVARMPGAPDAALLSGTVWRQRLNSGIGIYASAVSCLRDFNSDAELEPGLFCILALEEGSVLGASIDGKEISFASMPGREKRPDGFLISVAQPCRILRRGGKGRAMRKITVALPAAWLDLVGGDEGQALAFRRDHLGVRRWQPSLRTAEAAARILEWGPGPNRLLRSLAVETTALTIAEEALQSLDLPEATALSLRERQKAENLRVMIEAHLSRPLAMPVLAREAGMSIRQATALFAGAYHETIPAYIRRRRLDKAKDGIERSTLSISEIGYLAGYSSVANFSTAFRKRFGVTPKQARGA